MQIKKQDRLLIFFTISSWLSWLSVFNALFWDKNHSWWLPALLFVINLSFWCLTIFLEKRIRRALFLIAIFNLPIIFFFKNAYFLLFWALIFSIFFYWLGIINIFEEKRERTKIRIYKSFKIGFRYIILGFSIIISLGVFSLLQNNKISYFSTPEVKISPDSLKSNLNFSKKFVNDSQVKNDLNLLQENVVLLEFIKESNFFAEEAQYVTSSPEYQTVFLTKLASQIEVKKLTGEEKVLDLLANFLNKKINGFLGFQEKDQEKTTPHLLVVIILFFIINSLSWFLGILVKVLTQGWFYLLVKTKFLSVEKQEEKVEKIIFQE